MGLDFYHLTPDLLAIIEEWFSDDELRQRLGGMLPLSRWYEYVSQTPSQKVWVAYSQNEPIGFVNIEMGEDGTSSIGIAVKPNSRGKGFGKKLIEQAIAYSEKANIRVMIAGIEANNLASIRCFESVGFVANNSEPDDDGFVSYVYEITSS